MKASGKPPEGMRMIYALGLTIPEGIYSVEEDPALGVATPEFIRCAGIPGLTDIEAVMSKQQSGADKAVDAAIDLVVTCLPMCGYRIKEAELAPVLRNKRDTVLQLLEECTMEQLLASLVMRSCLIHSYPLQLEAAGYDKTLYDAENLLNTCLHFQNWFVQNSAGNFTLDKSLSSFIWEEFIRYCVVDPATIYNDGAIPSKTEMMLSVGRNKLSGVTTGENLNKSLRKMELK